MSRVHDALKRGLSGARTVPSPQASAHADVVLATLGYHPERRGETARRAVAIVCGLGVLATLGYVSWTWFLPSSTERPRQAAPQATVVVPTKRIRPAVPVQSPVRPAPMFGAAPAVTITPPTSQPPRAGRTGRIPAKGPGTDDFGVAVYYQRAGDVREALARYQALLRRDDLNIEAHNNLGLLYRGQRQFAGAEREFRRALAIAPHYSRARNNLGVTLLDEGRGAEAAAEFKTLLTAQPGDVDALVNLALAETASGELVDARGMLLRALEREPHNAAAHYNLAAGYEQAGEISRAIEHYRAFLDYATGEQIDHTAEVRARIAALTERQR